MRQPSKLAIGSIIAVLFVLLGGCAQKTAQHSDVPPDWVMRGANVGYAKPVASGNYSEQTRLAMERAIGVLLTRSGMLSGKALVGVEMTHSDNGNDETYNATYSVRSEQSIETEKRHFEIKMKEMWRNPRTNELFVQIEEVK